MTVKPHVLFNVCPFSVSRHITVYDVIYDVPDTPEAPRVTFPAHFKIRFKFQRGVQILDLRKNSGIRLETVGCIQSECPPTRQQVIGPANRRIWSCLKTGMKTHFSLEFSNNIGGSRRGEG